MVLMQTLKNHIFSLRFTAISTFLITMGWWYFEFDNDYLFIVGLFHAAFTTPALYLHIEYTLRNGNEEIELSYNEIIVRNTGEERRYSTTDLSKIILYKSASLDRGGIPLSAMEYYHFARIIVKTGEEIVITCLMSCKIDEEIRQLRGVPYERKKSFFCTTIWK